ncbi:flagellar biosynthesis protein FlhF [Brevibacillus parabrevis]|uniref:Flagellar biosynthesis protein FlhF n=1 Tax=Brevibacillus parabrevis TaxID=54914 RepID=A0A4Y3PKF6_BREPA|nr:flagellar biosynthesis protein FlhF [Brevibacillus parabrevis]RNB94305.1 flagellar biosynthesis protein FlhF [Brevibacillus parabrevis]GEB30931.1 flagellar biosynthesis protein FlhF [Brevibacillus parabrevis]
MRVKRYIVDSMPEAMEKIRLDLGIDAVILNSKSIKTGGLFGMFGKQKIEVIAAVDEKVPERGNTLVADEHRSKDVFSSKGQAGTYTAQQAYRKANLAKEPAEKTATLPNEQRAEAASKAAPPMVAPRTEAREQPSVQQAEIPAQVPHVSPESTGAAGNKAANDALANEVRDMRQMFQKLLVNDLSQQLPPAVQEVRSRLVSQEVGEEVTAEIIRKLLEAKKPEETWDQETAFGEARSIISSIVASYAPKTSGIRRDVQYAFFFGPTGVGKTTTIAKLAASSMLKEKRKIGFITADTYRMAAVEQLKTYANILNVPLEVVFSPKEMVPAMERLSDCDLIFVDTAGRNFRNDEYVQGIRELVEHGKNSMNYLVLSLSSKYNDMKTIVENFAEVPDKQVIFTKADETNSYGSVLNICHESKLALSYFTTGQNVPDDIVVATPELVATMIMGD